MAVMIRLNSTFPAKVQKNIVSWKGDAGSCFPVQTTLALHMALLKSLSFPMVAEDL